MEYYTMLSSFMYSQCLGISVIVKICIRKGNVQEDEGNIRFNWKR